MKSVVVEIKNDFAAVLSDNGTITKVKNKSYVVGQTIEIVGHKTNNIMKYASLAASIAILILGISGFTIYRLPYSYVSVDVNPSITFTLNRFDRVIDVSATNDDGYEILQELPLNELKNKTIKNALSKTVYQIMDAGFFDKEDKNGILIAASGINATKSQNLANELKESIDTELEQIEPNVEIEAITVDQDWVQQAKDLGITPGKLNLIESLKDVSNDPDFSIEEWSQKSVKDIMIAKNKSQSESIEEKDNTTTHSDTNINNNVNKQNNDSLFDENKDMNQIEKPDKANNSNPSSNNSISNSKKGTTNSKSNSESDKDKPSTSIKQNNNKNSDSNNSSGNTQKNNSVNKKTNKNPRNNNYNNSNQNKKTIDSDNSIAPNNNSNSDNKKSDSESNKKHNNATKKKVTNSESNNLVDAKKKTDASNNNTKDDSKNKSNTKTPESKNKSKGNN